VREVRSIETHEKWSAIIGMKVMTEGDRKGEGTEWSGVKYEKGRIKSKTIRYTV
jgi:hypothetical protein